MPDHSTTRFGELLRRHRLAAGLSQAELAERAGLSTHGIGALETGRRANPRPYTVRVLVDALSLAAADRLQLIAAAQALPPSPAEAPTAVARTADGPGHRLTARPRPPTRLIGREREVAEIAYALRAGRTRLLTLTGPGGVGKTRLAIAAAEVAAEVFPDGVAWIELAHIVGTAEDAASLVAGAIARAIGAKEPTPRALADTVAAAVGSRKMALVLDNFEHLMSASPFVADVLEACPELVMLVTSRERLHLRGEQEIAVHPLAVPDLNRAAGEDTTELAGVAAVRLFAERAKDVRGDFALTAANLPAVVTLCRHLDGLPLAIELAVRWVKVLPPDALAARLSPRLPLLTGGAGDLPDRQQTMRDTIAWSYDLLQPNEQRLFRRLAVFAGGFTVEAAEAVGGDAFGLGGDGPEGLRGSRPDGLRTENEGAPQSSVPSEATPPEAKASPPTTAGRPPLDLLAALVDKSLVRPLPTASGSVVRFGMLETIREFALERLTVSDEATACLAAHAAHIVALVETLIPSPGGEETGWLERLATEVPNLRGAHAHVVERGEAEAALRLAEAWQLLAWSSRADSGEALRWLEAAMALGGSAEARVHALIAASGLAALRGDHARAIAQAREGLAISRARDYPFGVAYALFYLGVAEEWSGNLDSAAARYAEAIAGWQRLGESYWVALAHTNLGIATLWQGDIAEAGAVVQAGLIGSRAGNDAWGIALALGALAAVACAQGELPRAAALNAESLTLWSSMGDLRGVAGALAGLAGVSVASGDYPQAARLLGAAAALAESVQSAHLVHHQQYERALAATRAALDPGQFAQHWAAGRARSPSGITALVAESTPVRD